MRVASIYDIHANLPALEAVLDDIRQSEVDQIVVGGDVLPGPMPLQTIRCLLSLEIPVQFIVGNGDREVLAAINGTETPTLPKQALEAIRWNAQQLGPEHEELLASWGKMVRLEINGLGKVLLCHATPRNDSEIFTRLTSEKHLLPIFEGVDAAVVVCGHTHMQFERMVGNTRLVNAGSVGMPFGEPGADWLLLDPGIRLRHTPYDLAKAAERIRATEYPQAEEFATRNILHPPSESQMLELFARAELK